MVVRLWCWSRKECPAVDKKATDTALLLLVKDGVGIKEDERLEEEESG
jgi:hypothetical protein